jgi:hypothetical protein
MGDNLNLSSFSGTIPDNKKGENTPKILEIL